MRLPINSAPRHGFEDDRPPFVSDYGTAIFGKGWVFMTCEPAATVLIVDDEDLVRMDSSNILQGAGFHVLEACDASQALQCLEQVAHVRILFTDVNMPGTPDGLGLAKLVHSRWPRMRILVASGAVKPAPEDLPEHGLFLSKPYSASELVALVRGLATT